MSPTNRVAVLFALGLAAVTSAAGCKAREGRSTAGSASAPRHVRVAAAADLRFAFEDLAAEFHRRRADVTVQVTYGSSGQLFAQLSNKAPFDMFLSADAAYPRQLVEAGRASKETQFRYGTGRLVVWTPDGSALDLNKLGLSALLDPSVRRIAIANPAHAPYGRAAESALKTLGVYDKVADKLVLGESVAQAAQFVQSGSADVGIIALSLAVATDLRSSGRFWEIPAAAYPPMVQEGVILSWCQDEDAADALRLFITSADGKAILAQYGFSTPGE